MRPSFHTLRGSLIATLFILFALFAVPANADGDAPFDVDADTTKTVADAGTPSATDAGTDEIDDADLIRELRVVRDEILRLHVGKKVTARQLHDALMKGMFDALDDPYSRYLTPEEAKLSDAGLSGEYSGIGAVLDLHGAVPIVGAVREKGPAAKAGLKPRDRIVAVNGVRTKDRSANDVVRMLRGPAGTKVHITVERNGCGEERTYAVVREAIVDDPVSRFTMKASGKRIAVVRIRSFNEKLKPRFYKTVNDVLRTHPDGLVIDLRDNPGGLVNVMGYVACHWLTKDAVVLWEYERTTPSPTSHTCDSDRAPLGNIPTVVLINGRSASASEILAGALQDHGKATIVGTTSFGKGIGQRIIHLPSGAEVHLTTFEWRTPKRRAVHGKGITPDVTVAAKPNGASKRAPDPQLRRAVRILTRH